MENHLMTALSALADLQAAVANLQAAQTSEVAEMQELVTIAQKAQADLATLQQTVANGGTVNADQIAAVTATVTGLVDSANAATAAALAAEPTPPAAG